MDVKSYVQYNIYIALQNGLYTILLMYIDVFLLIGDIILEIKPIKEICMSSFKLTDLDEVHMCLGNKHYKLKKEFCSIKVERSWTCWQGSTWRIEI
jgi:hypothetical protein